MSPSKKPAKKTRLIKHDFDVDLTLLTNRQLFLFDNIDNDTAKEINKAMFALDTVNKNPIQLYLNTGGGDVDAGLSIINTMKTIESPVVTIIMNEVCSMGAHISVSGNHRVCYEDSTWMMHDMSYYVDDYKTHAENRVEFYKKLYKNILQKHLKEHTDLTSSDLTKAKQGELWLFADDMLNKNIVDEILLHKPRKS